MTMENWQTVLFDSMRGGSKYVVAIFYISWIFLGNFIILNLFLAILLDSFLVEDEEDDLAGDADHRARKIKKAMIKKKQLDKYRVFMNHNFHLAGTLLS
jgi:hypothetical protein